MSTTQDYFQPHDGMHDDDHGPSGTIFLNDLAKLDSALFDPSKGIIGQSWRVDVTLSGSLDENGFVYDFGPLKKLVKQVLTSTLDHALIIPINSQAVQYRDIGGGRECWKLRSKPNRMETELAWEYTCPTGAVYPLRCIALNRHVIEQELSRALRHRVSSNVHQISVSLREEDVEPTEAVFRYTHGITNHNGLCQRLFHGHRSRIQVYVGDERRPDLEHYIVRDIFNTSIHIACPSQFKSGMIEPGSRGKGKENVVLSYQSNLGHFEASIPAERIFCVEGETSIEALSYAIAQFLSKEEAKGERVRVVCYEGIDKGAIAEI